MEEPIEQMITRKVREVVQRSRETRGRTILKWINYGYRLDELVLVEYIGWPQIKNLGVVDNCTVFECRDRFKVIPKSLFDGPTTQRRTGLYQSLRMEKNPYSAKDEDDEIKTTFTI